MTRGAKITEEQALAAFQRKVAESNDRALKKYARTQNINPDEVDVEKLQEQGILAPTPTVLPPADDDESDQLFTLRINHRDLLFAQARAKEEGKSLSAIIKKALKLYAYSDLEQDLTMVRPRKKQQN